MKNQEKTLLSTQEEIEAELKLNKEKVVSLNEEMKKLQKQIIDGESQRRKLHNIIQELRGNVRVFARVRPYIPIDGEETSGEVIDVYGEEDAIEIKLPSKMDSNHRFCFDKCFGQ